MKRPFSFLSTGERNFFNSPNADDTAQASAIIVGFITFLMIVVLSSVTLTVLVVALTH